MNKKALLGTIFLLAIIIILVTGTSFYFKFYKGGLTLTTSDIVLDINYNITKNINNTIQQDQENQEQTDTNTAEQEQQQDYQDNISIIERLDTNGSQVNNSIEFQELNED